jgi:hypothetical protein
MSHSLVLRWHACGSAHGGWPVAAAGMFTFPAEPDREIEAVAPGQRRGRCGGHPGHGHPTEPKPQLKLGVIRSAQPRSAAQWSAPADSRHKGRPLPGRLAAASQPGSLARPSIRNQAAMILVPSTTSGPPSPVGATNGSQRVQPSPDPVRRSQNLRPGQRLPVRLSPTLTDTRNGPGVP